MSTYLVAYAIMDGRGAAVGHGTSIEGRFVLPKSMDDIKRLGDNMTDEQRGRAVIRHDHWLSITGWSEMGL